jgi:hypothetical protein
MKKAISTILVLCIITLSLAACAPREQAPPTATDARSLVANSNAAVPETESPTQVTATPTTEEPTTKPDVITDQYLIDLGLPVYVPGSINLQPDGYFENEHDLPFTMKYRACYYKLPGFVEDLVTDPSAPEYVDDLAGDTGGEDGPNVMMIKAYIQRYNVPKEAFEAALAKENAAHVAHGTSLTDEEWEPPNADIIYTFDNEIINYYYRRA